MIDLKKWLALFASDLTLIDDYLTLCENHSDVDDFEVHHILPKAQYEQFANLKIFPENGVKLSKANHLIAHWMLYRIMKTTECTHAFRMMCEMKRGIESMTKDQVVDMANDYAAAKIKSNEFLADRMTKVMYITNGHDHRYIDKDDNIPDGYRPGRIPAFSTGSRIGITNQSRTVQLLVPVAEVQTYINEGWVIGGKQKTTISNGIEDRIVLGIDPIIPDGWVIGSSKQPTGSKKKGHHKLKGKPSPRKGKLYYTNPLNGDCVFCFPIDAPTGWTLSQPRNISKWLPDNCVTSRRSVWRDQNGTTHLLPSHIDFSPDFIEGAPPKSGAAPTSGRFWIHNSTGDSKMVNEDITGWVRGRPKSIK